MGVQKKMSYEVVVGRLGAAYGIKGWLHITSFTDPPDNIFTYKNLKLLRRTGKVALQLVVHKTHGKSYIVKLNGIDDRETAMQYKGLKITVDRADLPETQADEYYWSDLIGLEVITSEGISLGIIDHLFETGSNDVIVTRGKKQHMIPYLDHVVQEIDLDKQTMVVDWEPL